MKIQLSELDRKLIERINKKIGVKTYIDDEDYIEVNDILALLDDLEDVYDDLGFELDDYKVNHKPCDVNDNWQFYSHTIKTLQEEVNKQWDFIKKKGLEEEYGRYEN